MNTTPFKDELTLKKAFTEITNLDTANKDVLKEKIGIKTLIQKIKNFFSKKEFMAWNYRKRITIAPGVRLNISKKGVSTTFGMRGASINVGQSGTYLNTGIPGTGIYNMFCRYTM